MPITTTEPVSRDRRAGWWLDALVLLGLVAVVMGLGQLAGEWRHPLKEVVPIDLSPAALPRYALFSFARGWIAYFFSLLFTLLVASWAYYDLRARRYILPALDVLQSIPVLGFLPGITLALIALFPHSNTGLELACVLSIFTGQVWNMVFSYYDSLRGTPPDHRMLGRLYNFNWWNRFWRIELPFGAQGLIYNSMVGMAGGWFFLSVCEAPPGQDAQRVPGLGSYLAVANDKSDGRAQFFGIVAMGLVIVVTDRLIWGPLVVWSRKFKLDDFGGNRAPKTRWRLWLARSRFFQAAVSALHVMRVKGLPPPEPPSAAHSLAPPGSLPPTPHRAGLVVYWVLMIGVIALVGWGAWRLWLLLGHVPPHEWLVIFRNTGISGLRVLAAIVIGTLWTVPFGIWIGLNPRLSGKLQPLIQFVAAFPAPNLYPWLLTFVFVLGGTLQWGAILLILFGTQWYILFNVAGAASAIPNDMICCADILRLSRWTKWKKFLIPAILPGLVTGWITAAGGAWNATIVSEYVKVGGKLYLATGLGSYISRMSDDGNFSNLAAAVIVMAVVVVGINRLVWKRLQAVANERCRFIV